MVTPVSVAYPVTAVPVFLVTAAPAYLVSVASVVFLASVVYLASAVSLALVVYLASAVSLALVVYLASVVSLALVVLAERKARHLAYFYIKHKLQPLAASLLMDICFGTTQHKLAQRKLISAI